MKRIIALICFILCFSSCSVMKTEKYISDFTGIDFSSGKIISSEDTHGGFAGDGLLTVRAEFSKNMSAEIENNEKWKALPAFGADAYFMYETNEEISDFISHVKNGYYMLEDSGPGKDEAPEDRVSYNFICALYDCDENLLYFIKFDT